MTRNNSVAGVAVPVYNTAGNVVGEIRQLTSGRRWLEKTGLDPEVHMLHKPPAWCTDSAHIDLLKECGGVGVRLVTTTGTVWTATLEQFERHGFPVNRGHGLQIALTLAHWLRNDPQAGQQLELFAAVAS